MCGRFTLTTGPEELAERFKIEGPLPEFKQRFNVAPTQELPVILQADEQRIFRFMSWGLIPHWAKDRKIAYKMINARSETLAEKPSFRTALRSRRCLIPGNGFFEWHKLDCGGKQPYYFRLKSNIPFAFGGLWESWTSSDQQVVETFTIITTEANSLVSGIHERMPAILLPENEGLWLDSRVSDHLLLNALLRPYPADEMESYPVSSMVGNVANNIADCIQPIGDGS